MAAPDDLPRWNATRRLIGVVVALAPVALLLASLASTTPRDAVGLGFVIAGAAITTLNVATVLGARRLRPGAGVSGVPMVTTLAVVTGGVIGFGDARAALLGLVVYAVDAWGLLWFVVGTWRDASRWDR